MCHFCARASRKNLIELAKCSEEVFTTTGFKNWRKALEKFHTHSISSSHKLAVSNLLTESQQQNVDTQLDSQLKTSQEESQHVLIKLITSLRYLGERGLAARGKNHDDGNFASLLRLRSEDDAILKKWLTKSRSKYTSGEIQNEMFDIMANAIRQNICNDINQTTYFGVIVDGTQDINGKEQESICIRYSVMYVFD